MTPAELEREAVDYTTTYLQRRSQEIVELVPLFIGLGYTREAALLFVAAKKISEAAHLLEARNHAKN